MELLKQITIVHKKSRNGKDSYRRVSIINDLGIPNSPRQVTEKKTQNMTSQNRNSSYCFYRNTMLFYY